VIHRWFYEVRLAAHPAVWALPFLLVILRLISPSSPDKWLGFFEFVHALLFPVAVVALLERERRWCTIEVLVATPHAKIPILLARLSATLAPLFCAIAATVRPENWLTVAAPCVLLATVALGVGLIASEEVGLAVALGWWAISFAVNLAGMGMLRHPVANWFVLFLTGAGLPPDAVLLRKLAHLAVAVILLSICCLLIETWPRRLLPTGYRVR